MTMMTSDLEIALDALEEAMSYDKGMAEDEFINWCNAMLPFMKKHGRLQYVIEFC